MLLIDDNGEPVRIDIKNGYLMSYRVPKEGFIFTFNGESVLLMINSIDKDGRISFSIRAVKSVKITRIREVKK